ERLAQVGKAPHVFLEIQPLTPLLAQDPLLVDQVKNCIGVGPKRGLPLQVLLHQHPLRASPALAQVVPRQRQELAALPRGRVGRRGVGHGSSSPSSRATRSSARDNLLRTPSALMFRRPAISSHSSPCWRSSTSFRSWGDSRRRASCSSSRVATHSNGS